MEESDDVCQFGEQNLDANLTKVLNSTPKDIQKQNPQPSLSKKLGRQYLKKLRLFIKDKIEQKYRENNDEIEEEIEEETVKSHLESESQYKE